MSLKDIHQEIHYFVEEGHLRFGANLQEGKLLYGSIIIYLSPDPSISGYFRDQLVDADMYCVLSVWPIRGVYTSNAQNARGKYWKCIPFLKFQYQLGSEVSTFGNTNQL